MKPIPNFEGVYSMDPHGAIFSHKREVVGKDGVTYTRGGKQLRYHTNSQNGYLQVDLWKNNKAHRFYVHRIVAELYVPNPNNKPEVNHKNSDRSDFSPSNLEWVTSKENSKHGYSHGYASQKKRRKLGEQDYLVIYSRFIGGESFAAILKDFSISPGRLSTNLSKLVKKWGKEQEYAEEKLRQQQERAKINGSN